MTTPPPGIRNNNPGNIDFNPTIHWQGQTGANGRFCVFTTPVMGIRALAKNALAKQDLHGFHTVRKIITAWAPPNENNTLAYVRVVSKAMGVSPDDVVDLHVKTLLTAFVTAVIRHENGIQPYAAETIAEGVNLALGVKPGA